MIILKNVRGNHSDYQKLSNLVKEGYSMRIFEKISRRLAITLASAMACSSFAMAPAITAYAAERPGTPDYKALDDISKGDFNNGETKEVTLGKAVWTDDKASEDAVAVYKFKTGIDGKLHVTIKAKEEIKDIQLAVFKKDAEKEEFYEDIINIAKDKTHEKVADIKEGEYYIAIGNDSEDSEAKFDLTIETRTTYNSSKIGKVESPAKKTAKVTIKKVKKIDGYEIQASTSRDFDKNVKKKSVKAKKVEFKDKKGTIEVKKLKSGKKYYVRVRTYVKKDGVKYYSDWSKTKKLAKVK